MEDLGSLKSFCGHTEAIIPSNCCCHVGEKLQLSVCQVKARHQSSNVLLKVNDRNKFQNSTPYQGQYFIQSSILLLTMLIQMPVEIHKLDMKVRIILPLLGEDLTLLLHCTNCWGHPIVSFPDSPRKHPSTDETVTTYHTCLHFSSSYLPLHTWPRELLAIVRPLRGLHMEAS